MFHVSVVEGGGSEVGEGEEEEVGRVDGAGGMEAGLEAMGEEAAGWVEAGWVEVSEAKRRDCSGLIVAGMRGWWRRGLRGFFCCTWCGRSEALAWWDLIRLD